MHVLNNSRCTDGSEFTLLDSLHVENLFFFEDVSVLIKGGATQSGNSIRTTLQVNDTQSYLIYIVNGRSTLQNLELNFTKLANGTVIPSLFLIYVYNSTSTGYKSHTIISSIFNGMPNATVRQIIYSDRLDKLEIRDCIFQNVLISNFSLIKFNFYSLVSEVTVQNSKFINITLANNYGFAVLDLYLVDSNSTVVISGCLFEKCINNGNSYGSAGAIQVLSFNANDQYTFTNNTFTNNSGYYAGAICIDIRTKKCNFSDNYFSHNTLTNGTDQRGCDFYINWSGDRPSGWSRDNYESEITKLLVGSKSAETNSIHYTIWSTSDVSQYQNWYVNIAEQPPVVDPPIVDPPPVIQGICERKVNQTYTGSDINTKQTVGDVLYQTCTGGYRITMVSQVHVEFVNVSKPQTAPVLIKGGAISGGREIRTSMSFNSYQPHTVLLDQGNLTLQNLEFNFTFLSNQSIYPALSLIGTSNSTSASYYKSLTIISCVLNGLGNIQVVNQMVFANESNIVIMRDNIFQNALIQELRFIYCNTSRSGAEFIIESSKFVNIKNYHIYGSGISLQFGGQNQKITINQCTFENISCNVTYQGTGALDLASLVQSTIFNITQNQFINCVGDRAGAFTAIMVSDKLFFQNNSFSGNKLIRSDQRGQDAFLWWRSEPTGWNYSNTLTKIQSLIKGSISTDINSINYSTPSVQGFISLPKEQLEYCKSKAELTSDCECDPDSTTYPSSTCERDKKCTYDLANQTNQTCPCLSSGDPRAGNGQCPAYCVAKDSLTANCICDSNSSTYPTSNCEKDKLCITDLANQPNSSCPCLNTSDPRAGKGQCPAYCIQGQVTQQCVCDTGISSYPTSTCEREKLCTFNLINQTN
ncbi:MAG: hypothetical protein EZS28_030316, partial [Streblomastix strix]